MNTTQASSSARARRPVTARHATLWAFLIAATLVFKSFVPMLAAASAALQGKAVADICSVYGVRLAETTTSAPMDMHAGHDMASMPGMTHLADDGPASHARHHHDDRDHSEHARDHCALSGLAVCAVFAAVLLGLPAPAVAPAPTSAPGLAEPVADASARWLALRLHAPPLRG